MLIADKILCPHKHLQNGTLIPVLNEVPHFENM